MQKEKIILGIDPGTSIMGYGLIEVKKTEISLIQLGVLDLKKINSHEIFNTFQDSDFVSFEIESIQYKAARIITGAWDKSNKKKLYKLLDWESMQD